MADIDEPADLATCPHAMAAQFTFQIRTHHDQEPIRYPPCAAECLAWRLALAASAMPLLAAWRRPPHPLRLGVGLFQPDREKNDATYRPLAAVPGAAPGPRRWNCAPSTRWEGLAKIAGHRRDRPRADGPLGLRAGQPHRRRAGGGDHPVRRQARILRAHRHAPGLGHPVRGRPEGAQTLPLATRARPPAT